MPSRSDQRRRLAKKIEGSFPAAVPCDRCVRLAFVCHSDKNGRCAGCVLANMSGRGKCNAEYESRADRALRKEKEFQKERFRVHQELMQKMSENSAEIARSQKIIERLEAKSGKELQELSDAVEAEDAEMAVAESLAGEASESSGGAACQVDSFLYLSPGAIDESLRGSNVFVLGEGSGSL
jgi:hypothetical protein